jgi:GTP-binding protein Era
MSIPSVKRTLDTHLPSPHNWRMDSPHFPLEFRAGYVALIGRPNVGKSTLINTFLGQKIAATSQRPQTTQRSQLAILTRSDSQVIFVDTPGIHEPRHQLGERMNAYAESTIGECDLILAVFDIHLPPREDDSHIVETLGQYPEIPVIAVLNKVDLLPADEIDKAKRAFQTLLPDTEMILLSAFDQEARQWLFDKVVEQLPVHPPFFDDDQITDHTEREIAADLIRAAAMHFLQQELPYAIAVRVDEYQARGESRAYISATLFVERSSQKGIVIGKNGSMLRQIGTMAREQIEAMSGLKVYLDLRVKVLKKWRNNQAALSRLGYPIPRQRK